MNEDIKSIMSVAGPGGPEPSDAEFAAGGFIVLNPSRGGREAADMGMTAHRGTLHPDEYIDKAVLRDAALDSLGFTYEEVSSVYRQGPLAPEQRQLRERIDSRLLALSRSGGNMTLLAMSLNLGDSVIDRALKRAREVEVAPIVKNPAVLSRHVCFKCEVEGAKPRRRRHSKSPAQWVGTVNLCDADYAAGFEPHPGSTRYWEHRLSTRPVTI